ncbi:aminotransferase class III-fold pyridoxal phosphate-dependent enzyme [Streptomyces sp. NPDC056512]|uniref:aminotransferase class III-fold pyridoxal phosphate-dependent enzyme n=1 Tax=Streptomyces sp. NPDC056512 TaxID=3345846 RepID=UPI0036C8BA56
MTAGPRLLYDKALDVWEPGAHIGTFRGNQLAFAAGLESLAVFEDENILENVRQRSAEAKEFLAHLTDELDLIKEVRGVGLMIGVELRDTDEGREAARRVQKLALEKGLIIELGGRDDLVLRLLPPLNIAGDVLLDGLSRFASALREAAASCR